MARVLSLILVLWVGVADAACTGGYRGMLTNGYIGRAGGIAVSDLSSVCAAGNPSTPLAAGPSIYHTTSTGAASNCGYWTTGAYPQFVISIGVQVDSGYWSDTGKFVGSPTDPACSEIPDDCSAKSPLGGSGTTWSYSGDYPGYGGGYCIDGCSYDLHGYESYDKKSNMSAAKGTMRPTGGQCSDTKGPVTSDPSVNESAPTTKPDGTSPDPSACSGGGVPYKGTVNGKPVTACGSPSKTTTTDSSQKDSSSTRTESGGTPTSGSSSETKTTKTTCADGKCTTTTTKSDSTGGGTSSPGGSESSGTETKTESQADYCKDNPAQPICKQDGESTFGGSCGAFSCDGDAIQCAIAREQHQRNCEFFEDTKALPQVGVGQGATDGTGSGDFVNSEDSSVFSLASYIQQFENTVNLPSTCIQDLVIPFAGNQVVIPFSEYCDSLRAVGYAGNGITMIIALNMVFGGRKR